jgi:NAD-dependent DNA ligase
MEKDSNFYNRIGGERISDRQVDELIGLARGVLADGKLNQDEVEFIQKWLAANTAISDQPLIRTLYRRVNEVLKDGVLDAEETAELIETLNGFVDRNFELGETMKSTSLPLDEPAPVLMFPGKRYCFTGTFTFGQRKDCERVIVERGGQAGGLSQKTNVLVIGTYATESWKHSSFGNKILQACEWRDEGRPICIVSERHWVAHL